jgi:hypothetical protein
LHRTAFAAVQVSDDGGQYDLDLGLKNLSVRARRYFFMHEPFLINTF